jgi:hypothetical protein
MARYLERAEHTARVLAVKLEAMLDQSPVDADEAWVRVTAALAWPVATATEGQPLDIERTFTIDRAHPSSIISAVRLARDNARQVRELISTEMWGQLNRLYLRINTPEFERDWARQPVSVLHDIGNELLLFAGITKYNVGSKSWRRPASARRVILIPGQVESDASIRLSSNRISSNLDLVQSVRQVEPEAFVIYKPHPDVAAGLRRGGQESESINEWCNQVLVDADMHSLLEQIDEVHTMTSLTGFEALLRGKKVVTYGMPFYAGWGLTDDRDMAAATTARRGRTLDIDELAFASLVLYPLYADHTGRRLDGPEQAINELVALKQKRPRPFRVLRAILRLRSY